MSIAPLPTSPSTPAAGGPAGALGYASAPPDPAVVGPTEFDVELESERTRWIRRRFLWFCAVNVVVVVGFYAAFSKDLHAAPPVARVFNVLDLALVSGGYAAAFVYVWRVRLSLRQLLRLGLYLTAVLPVLSIVFTRIDMSLNPEGYDFWGPIVDAGTRWALISPVTILIGFSIACVFVPWSAREALLPAAAVLAANAMVILGDALFTIRVPTARYLALGGLVASPLAVLPGLGWRWWRYGRFRKFFPVLFESFGYRKLQGELAGARRLHESTLPPPHFHAAGPARLAYAYEPMRQIGGDVLYVHPNEHSDSATRLSVVLIDVTGHGIAAALMANRLIGETQRLYAEDPDARPHQVLAALNRYVRLTMARDGVYATALVTRLDAATDTLEYANGGHPPALLRRADGTVARLDSSTYLLGCYDGGDFCTDCETFPFHAGDALFAYTDGATEARDGAGAMLTIDGVERLLIDLARTTTPDRWPPGLLQLVVNHRRAPAADDTLLVSLYRP